MPPKRYFEDERSAKPGVISDELRAALNLHDDKLPAWIYRMRVLGYPPGWLQQADISSSSLQLFDDSSQARQSTSSQGLQEKSFNPECFVEFPGFNAPVPEGVKDQCEVLGMPPMQVWQQLNYVKKTIQPPKPVPYKRLKLSKNDSDKNGSTVNIDDDDEIIIIESPSKPEKRPERIKVPEREKEEGEATDSDDDIITISSSNEEPKPEMQKDASTLNISTTIIEELPRSQSPNDSILLISPTKPTSNDQPSTSSSQPPIDSNPDQTETTSEMEQDRQEVVKSTDSQHETQTEDKPPTVEVTPQSPAQTKSPSIKLIGMGCPVPADVDSKKPPLEKFAVGMGELIYFENLPTSTGVFDKMRGVIHKVRKKLSQ